MVTSRLPASNSEYPSQVYETLGVPEWSDERLVTHVIDTVSQPRQAQTDSFLLHAPLEVLARYRLLGFVDEARRPAARTRLLGVATQIVSYGPPIATPDVGGIDLATESDESLLARLVASIRSTDLETLDLLSIELGNRLSPEALTNALVDFVAPFTAAAGHAPIFLSLAMRSDLDSMPVRMLRPLVRELARFPEWRIRWPDGASLLDSVRSIDTPSVAEPAATGAIFGALASAPYLGDAGSNFVHPVMSQVDPEPAADLLGALDWSHAEDAATQIMRAAAISMLAEPTDQAPYGWTHCLTMPQALCLLAGHARKPQRLLAIAATHVVGFRAAFAVQELRSDFTPGPSTDGWCQALDLSPDAAASAVWHSEATDADIIQELASRAAVHHDTHLVKYTIACIDATAEDSEAGRLYLAAAAKLSAWWSAADRSEVAVAK